MCALNGCTAVTEFVLGSNGDRWLMDGDPVEGTYSLVVVVDGGLRETAYHDQLRISDGWGGCAVFATFLVRKP